MDRNISGDVIAKYLTNFTPLTRLLFVICGAVLIHLSLGSYHTFGNMLPYIASYMKNYTDSSVNHEILIWIPTFQSCFPFAMVIGGLLSSKLGLRFATSLGCFIMASGVFLSYWTIQISFLAFLITYGMMFGLGQGIAYVLTISCVINWAPKHVGLVSGIVAAGFGFSSSIFAPLQTIYLNPLNCKPTVSAYFTDIDLVRRVPSAFYIFAIVYAIMQIIGLIFICNPINLVCSYLEFSKNNERDDEVLENGMVDLREESISLSPSEILKTSTFLWLFCALFCCSFYGNMFYNLYKTFGETFIDDDLFMAYAFSIASMCNALARIGWGILTDQISFQKSLSIATLLATVLLLTMPLTPKGGKWLYFMNLMLICLAATHALFITASVKCFGTDHKSTNYGCLIFSTVCILFF
ncbi:unnamed protein product [Thelazia callipaeda]|uniref:MFS domain-containing protein n=1 Tax=Thelazia callipaeda TaxID=103827 RepID=A0A0N5CMZ0_THECL|nr:unnamed protein product [Thelazia callipaeda]